MKYLKKLIDTVRIHGILEEETGKPIKVSHFNSVVVGQTESVVIHGEVLAPYLKKQYPESELRPIYDSWKGRIPDRFIKTKGPDSSLVDRASFHENFNHPFDCTAYEILDGYYQMDDTIDVKECPEKLNREAFNSLKPDTHVMPNLTNRRHVLCWLAAPGFTYKLISFEGIYRVVADVHYSVSEIIVLSNFAKMINENSDGVEFVKKKIKIGSGKAKRFHTIKRIIHVFPKRKRTGTATIEGRTISFSHRFVRRGHWRDLPHGGLGKNRAGDYVVQGKTWVIDSTVGPKEVPLIRKTRLVQA